MLIKIYGAAVQGIDATLITIEVNTSKGCMYYLVGLPDSAVKESYQRIRSALSVNNNRLPTCTTTINMAPADIRKEGSAYDLPLAIGMLGANQLICTDHLHEYLIMGELSLDGSVHPIKGALPISIKARELGFKGMIVPKENAREAAVVNNLDVYGVENIMEVIDFFNGQKQLEPTIVNTREEFYAQQSAFDMDFADVKGQEHIVTTLKKNVEVLISGYFSILYSRRPLLTNYKNQIHSNQIQTDRMYTLIESTRTARMPILEDRFGTTIYSEAPIQSFKELPILKEHGLSRFRIDSLFFDDEWTIQVLQAYKTKGDLPGSNRWYYQKTMTKKEDGDV